MKSLAKKLVQVRKNIKDPVKSGYLKIHKHHYSTKDDVFEVVRVTLPQFGLAVLPSQKSVEFLDTGKTTKGGDIIRKAIVEMEMTILDEETGESFTQTIYGESNTNDDKGIPQATTQALRFWAINTFQLLDGEVEYMTSTHEAGQTSQENIHREEATIPAATCRRDIRDRIKEVGFSKPQWECFKIGLAIQEEADSFDDIPHARILLWRNRLLESEDDTVGKRCLKIAKKGRKHQKSAA